MTRTTSNSSNSLQELLDSRKQGAHRPHWRLIAGGSLLAALGFGLFLLLKDHGQSSRLQYITEEAALGHLIVTASASGTLQPTRSIEVGSELSGTLATVLVHENDVVKRGQLLAQLDTAKLTDAVVKSRASVQVAQASVAQYQATVAESQASLARMRRVAEMSGGKVPSKSDLDSAEASLRRAQANEASARADVVQAQASLKTDETNLSKATIRSPVDGVVLSRKVEPGNTVVAAMNTPVLFVLAEDLSKMELQIKVDEADVANIRPGQEASFTVSAWPGRRFPATIQRVGLGSTTTDNVVTYKTILQVENKDMALRPGMTASAKIVTARRTGVLLVPSSALRFVPPNASRSSSDNALSEVMPKPPEAPRPRGKVDPGAQLQVWVLEAGGIRAIPVATGVSDGKSTEILTRDLRAGMAVITDTRDAQK